MPFHTPALLFSFLSATLVALVLTRTLISLAPHLGYLDHPSPRKAHRAPTPLLGGVATFAAFFVSLAATCVLFRSSRTTILTERQLPVFFFASFAMLALGLYDDRKILAPLPKFFGLCLASALPALLLSCTGAPLSEIIACAAALLFFSNSLNLLDNSDGQCASVAAAALAAAALHSPLPTRLAALGALLGFLWWNRPPARIFLGDAGSLLVGAWCVLLILRDPAQHGFVANLRLLPALWVPFYDTCSVIVLRLWQRRPIWQGGQDHFAWRLIRHGLTPNMVNLSLALATFLPATLAIYMQPLNALALFSFLIFCTAAGELVAAFVFPSRRFFSC